LLIPKELFILATPGLLGLNPKIETIAFWHTLQGKGLQVAKRRVGRYPKAFRKMAVERLKGCDNIVALSEELGVHRRLLYKWRDQLEPIEDGQGPPENSKERELRLQVAQLKRLVADKALEADFFKGALQKVEARRQSNTQPGEAASTTKSGS
jgi:transposase-like protein